MEEQVFNDVLAGSEIGISGEAFSSQKPQAPYAAQSCTSLFFPGCSFLNADPSLVQDVFGFLKERGLADGVSLLCCGKILMYEQDAETLKPAFQEELRQSIEAHGVKRIITACPNCVHELREVLDVPAGGAPVEVVPLPAVFLGAGVAVSAEMVQSVLCQDGQGGQESTPRAGALPALAIHDSCPDRSIGEFASSVRALFPAQMLAEMEHNRQTAFCCGSLANAAGRPDVAQSQAHRHGAEAQQASAQAIVTYCMSCARLLGRMQDDVATHHYLEFLFRRHLDWKGMAPYLEMRFLFEEMQGTRDYFGAKPLE